MPVTEGESQTSPTKHQLSAQRKVMATVGDGSEITSLHTSYPRMPTGGLISSVELREAELTLIRMGLLSEIGPRIVPTELGLTLRELGDEDFAESIVLLWLVTFPPLWLSAAARDSEVFGEFIPEDAVRRFEAAGLSPEQRDGLLLAAARKFDTSDSAVVGLAGEVAVLSRCHELLAIYGRDDLHANVVHVSLISDQLGYDIKSPDGADGTVRIEVKTCSTRGKVFRIYLSRNEAECGRRDPDWRIVVCRYVDSVAEVVGWCSFSQIAGRLPTDPPSGGRWASVEINLGIADVLPGMPLFVQQITNA